MTAMFLGLRWNQMFHVILCISRGAKVSSLQMESVNNLRSHFRLSILGLAEVCHGLPKDISHVVSLVDPSTALPRSLEAVPYERRLVLRVHDALDSTDGRVMPTRKDALALCDYADKIDRNQLSHLLVHCHMGRSRSAAAATVILLRLGCPSPREAFLRVVEVRSPVWPNWTLLEHGDDVLGCRGELLRECEHLYRQVRERFPEWVQDPREETLLMGAVDRSSEQNG